MIAGLHGKLEALGADWAVINVNGVCFQVYLPTSTMSNLSTIGAEVHLHTHLHFREDNIALYGFASPEELGLFQTLLTVSGIGPRLALAMLSAMSAERLTMAIATGNIDLLTEVPGIGNKTASRIVLELKDKIAAGYIPAPVAQAVRENTDVLAALTGLGYSLAEATRAVTALPTSGTLSLEERVTLALQYLGSK
ncbi:MAG: Holliday junction branch migration protein RuvA [Chloroflexi bacterium]|nr:Holliday junction branch migration protein RuvA [Chloroflexota bacterium]